MTSPEAPIDELVLGPSEIGMADDEDRKDSSGISIITVEICSDDHRCPPSIASVRPKPAGIAPAPRCEAMARAEYSDCALIPIYCLELARCISVVTKYKLLRGRVEDSIESVET